MTPILPSRPATTKYWLDADADGYRDCSAESKTLCAPAAPYTATESANCDCDDTVAADPAIPSSRGYSVVNKGKDADHDGWGDCKAALGWFCPGNDYTAPGYLSAFNQATIALPTVMTRMAWVRGD